MIMYFLTLKTYRSQNGVLLQITVDHGWPLH